MNTRADPAVRLALTIPEAVAWSGISRTTLYRLASEGSVMFRKMGRTTLVDAASLAAFVSSLPIATIRSAA